MSFVVGAHSGHSCVIAAVAFAAPALASAQEASDQGVSPPGAEAPASRKAVGVTIDLLPIVLSASAGEVGLSGQLWGAIPGTRWRRRPAAARSGGWSGIFFIEPWTAAHLRLTPASASLAGETYEPQWLSAEVSLEIGIFVDL